MQLSFTTLDVFTKTRYLGNPLAVVRVPASLRSRLTEEQKQKIAKEFNYSEITFLHEPSNAEPDIAEYDIFTPLSRMTFAGHPTIGTSLYVATHTAQYPGVTKLRTLAGIIPFELNQEMGTSSVSIPVDYYHHKKRLLHPFPETQRRNSGSETVPLVSIVKGMAFNLISMNSLDELALPRKGLIPIEELYKHEHLDQGSGWDIGYTGSFFYVDLGTDPDYPDHTLVRTRSLGSREDPGTGSASAALSSYLTLSKVEGGAKGPFRYHLVQGVEMGRRCDIFVSVKPSDDLSGIAEVKLSGNAVEIMEGVLTVG